MKDIANTVNFEHSGKKITFHTLGCKLNFAETSAIGKQLLAEGYVKARAGEEADICIINTCSVTDVADHKCRQAINRLHRQHPDALMVITGCYAQLKPAEIAKIEGVDVVLGANEKFGLTELLKKYEKQQSVLIKHSNIRETETFRPSCSYDDRTRFFLKVQDGCDYFCTYCTIPMARGRSRNASVAQTLQTAKQAIAEGAKEIVLSGVNTGDFGKSTGENFFDLVKALDDSDAEIRFRVSSIEPNLLTDELIEYVAASRHFMPHFHIPLQSGSNEVLKLMKRRYDTALFSRKIEKIKNTIPDAFIGVDVIVGVRGEKAELFEETTHFIKSLDISQLHVFTYSERMGTKMLDVDFVVPPKERKRRSDVLHTLSAEKTTRFYERQTGKTRNVLWENRHKGGKMTGFTDNYIRVVQDFNKEQINTIQAVVLGDWNEDGTALNVKVQ
ncbi:MAG: tRNA (N(6)-L-threonylcarbamoyladenosine(37)-C(2))-methylthiotransferase MtaB [Prevotellaceae bacterium]|jgi:threonylcarbamoyladenosine tRNA methylthiotransferase MtaB|nr:tRNA (N(6)-L-threonylcarbamoyladenosine(37)-C(2))-methylthiotransferase MtaB [Prevotellaceae bacterium]